MEKAAFYLRMPLFLAATGQVAAKKLLQMFCFSPLLLIKNAVPIAPIALRRYNG